LGLASFSHYYIESMTQSTSLPKQIILVTGATRSGKSEWAEHNAFLLAQTVIYVATAPRDQQDPEWIARVKTHQLRRPAHWQTREITHDIANFIDSSDSHGCLLIDSLGGWVANCLTQESATWEQTRDRFLDSLQSSPIDIILVAEETGWGIVPAYPLGRLFRDRLGDLSRRVGAIASTVYLVTGGHALNLSQLGTPLPPASDASSRS